MTRLVLSIFAGALLGVALGLWSIRTDSTQPKSLGSVPPPASPLSPAPSAHRDPSSKNTAQLLSELRKLVPEGRLQLQAWRDGRITTEMATALGLSPEEETRLNTAVNEMADEMARASHARVQVEIHEEAIALIVPEFSKAGEARNRLHSQFRETIGDERTRLLLSATGSRGQLDRACRFFGEYEQIMELRTTGGTSGTLRLNEIAQRYGDVVDEHGRSLGHRYVMQRVPLLTSAAADRAQLERFAGVRWHQLVPASLALQIR